MGNKKSKPNDKELQDLQAQALLLQSSGDLESAKALFEQMLAHDRTNLVALYSLGAILQGQQKPKEALGHFERVCKANPVFAPAHFARATTLAALGRFAEAMAAVRTARRIDAALPDAKELEQRLEQAMQMSTSGAAAPLSPTGLTPPPKALQALQLQNEGKLPQAKALFLELLTTHPTDFVSLYSLGIIEQQSGDPKSALAYLDRAVEAHADRPEGHYAKGTVLHGMGVFEQAIACFDHALALNPDYKEAYVNKATSFHSMGQHGQALTTLAEAVQKFPDAESLLNNYGYLLTEFKQYSKAAEIFNVLLSKNRSYEFALGLHAFARLHACDWTDFEANRREIFERIEEGHKVCNPMALTALTDSAELLYKNALTFGKAKFPQAPYALWRGEKYVHRRPRVAFLSADFREHPVGYLLVGLIESIAATMQLETFGVFLGNADGSDLYKRYRVAFDHYLSLGDRTSLEVAQILRSSEIDVAIDLSGYTAGSRLDILASRPAPVQMTYLGFPGTLGLPYIDYILGDTVTTPAELQPYYSEKILQLPHCYLPRDLSVKPSTRPQSRADQGLPEKGIVFCSFNHDYKINPPMFDVWMDILREYPDSCLWLMKLNDDAQTNLQKEAAKRDIDPGRLVFATRVPAIEDHLARYALADLCLDTFPYNGHTTTSDALYSGVPVVTLQGQGFASRVSASLLTDLSCQKLTATSHDDYKHIVREALTSRAGAVSQQEAPRHEANRVSSVIDLVTNFSIC